jgi:type III secretory pathway component EscV
MNKYFPGLIENWKPLAFVVLAIWLGFTMWNLLIFVVLMACAVYLWYLPMQAKAKKAQEEREAKMTPEERAKAEALRNAFKMPQRNPMNTPVTKEEVKASGTPAVDFDNDKTKRIAQMLGRK